MIEIDEAVLAGVISTLERLALKGANGLTEPQQALGHEIGREATTLKDAVGWTHDDLAYHLDHPARFLEWRDEFTTAYQEHE